MNDLTKAAFKHMKAMEDTLIPFLEFLDVIPIAETTERLVVRGHFDAELTILDFGKNFKRFLNKVEEPSKEAVTSLYRYRIPRFFAEENQIITNLGGEVKAETRLAQIFSLLKQKQESGEVKVFFRGWNVFFSRDAYGSLRSVRVTWDIHHQGYAVHSFPVAKYYLYKGDQVFSPNPGTFTKS